MSRAYYGALHCAQAFLEEIGIPEPVSRENKHVFVQMALLASGNENAKRAGSLLGALHQSRKEADCHISSNTAGSQDRALGCVDDAGTVRDLLPNFGDTTAKAEIRARILAWKKMARK